MNKKEVKTNVVVKKDDANIVPVTINCQDEKVAEVVFNLFVGKQSEFRSDMNKILASRGLGLLDSTFQDVDPVNLTLSILSIPTDKGNVFTVDRTDKHEVYGDVKISKYKDLNDEQFYGHIDSGTLKVFQYRKTNADIHVHVAGNMDVLKTMLITFDDNFQKERSKKEKAVLSQENHILKSN